MSDKNIIDYLPIPPPPPPTTKPPTQPITNKNNAFASDKKLNRAGRDDVKESDTTNGSGNSKFKQLTRATTGGDSRDGHQEVKENLKSGGVNQKADDSSRVGIKEIEKIFRGDNDDKENNVTAEGGDKTSADNARGEGVDEKDNTCPVTQPGDRDSSGQCDKFGSYIVKVKYSKILYDKVGIIQTPPIQSGDDAEVSIIQTPPFQAEEDDGAESANQEFKKMNDNGSEFANKDRYQEEVFFEDSKLESDDDADVSLGLYTTPSTQADDDDDGAESAIIEFKKMNDNGSEFANKESDQEENCSFNVILNYDEAVDLYNRRIKKSTPTVMNKADVNDTKRVIDRRHSSWIKSTAKDFTELNTELLAEQPRIDQEIAELIAILTSRPGNLRRSPSIDTIPMIESHQESTESPKTFTTIIDIPALIAEHLPPDVELRYRFSSIIDIPPLIESDQLSTDSIQVVEQSKRLSTIFDMPEMSGSDELPTDSGEELKQGNRLSEIIDMLPLTPREHIIDDEQKYWIKECPINNVMTKVQQIEALLKKINKE